MYANLNLTPRFMSYNQQYLTNIFSWKGIERKHDIDYFGHLCNSRGVRDDISNLFTTTGKKPPMSYSTIFDILPIIYLK